MYLTYLPVEETSPQTGDALYSFDRTSEEAMAV